MFNMSVVEFDMDDDFIVVFVIILLLFFFQFFELVEQLKVQLEFEEVFDNLDNIVIVLMNLKYQGEVILDLIYIVIDEGEMIIEEFKFVSFDGVDLSLLQYVEKVIKEFDRVWRVIEYLWM